MTGQPALDRPFDTTLPMLLLRAREAIIEPVRASLRLYGLTDQQWRVLRVLASSGEMETTRLAQAVFLRPPSLTRIVRDLVGKGFVSRRVDPKDRRVIVIAIEPAARTLIQDALPIIMGLGADMRAQYGPERLEALRTMLLDLISVFDPPRP